jgi:3alpha(or 20beta)-hydroxysteroid dehydrogenase
MGRLDGKVALISGGARGQGEAEARLFVAEGASVVIGDVLDEQGEKVAADLGDQAVYCHLDVTEGRDWQRDVATVKDRFERLDVLINNAGIVRLGMMLDVTLEEYREVVDVNQIGCWLGMKTSAPLMGETGGGSIINVSSMNGIMPGPGAMSYIASKFAIRGMTKAAALELAPLGIRVNSIHPGAIDTDMAHQALGNPEGNPVGHLPIPRMGRPDEVAKMAIFLATDDSSYSTGSEFIIDGGWLVTLAMS